MSSLRVYWVEHHRCPDPAGVQAVVIRCLAELGLEPAVFEPLALCERPLMGRKLAVRVVPSLVLRFDERCVVIPGTAAQLTAARIKVTLAALT